MRATFILKSISLMLLSPFSYAQLQCSYLEYYPYAFVENGQARGTMIEILNKLDNRVVFNSRPPARVFNQIAANSLSCGMASSIALSSEVQANYYYLPLHAANTYIFYLRSNGEMAHSDFKGETVAVVRGVKQEAETLQLKYGATIVEVENAEQALNMLLDRRMKGFHMSKSAVINLTNYDAKKIAHLDKPSILVTAGFYINRREKVLYDQLKLKSHAFFKTSEYTNILKKYLKNDHLVKNSQLK